MPSLSLLRLSRFGQMSRLFYVGTHVNICQSESKYEQPQYHASLRAHFVVVVFTWHVAIKKYWTVLKVIETWFEMVKLRRYGYRATLTFITNSIVWKIAAVKPFPRTRSRPYDPALNVTETHISVRESTTDFTRSHQNDYDFSQENESLIISSLYKRNRALSKIITKWSIREFTERLACDLKGMCKRLPV